MLPTSKVQNGQCGVYAFWPSNTFRKVFGICIVLVQFLVPLFTLVFCYVKIALVLSKRIKVSNAGQKEQLKTVAACTQTNVQVWRLTSTERLIRWSRRKVRRARRRSRRTRSGTELAATPSKLWLSSPSGENYTSSLSEKMC